MKHSNCPGSGANSSKRISNWLISRRTQVQRRKRRRQLSCETLECRWMMHGEGPPEYDPSSPFHIHAALRVFVDGQQLPIPEGVGNSLGANLHTHDASGLLHLHPNPPTGDFVTLGDWFDVWRNDTVAGNPAASLSANRLMDRVVDETSTLKMYVNGMESTEFGDYRIHDQDKITLAFSTNPVVTFQTNMGAIPIELLADETPNTVANFLSYVDEYPGTIFHRAAESPPGTEFVVQGGGFAPADLTTTNMNTIAASEIPTSPPIGDEPNRSNQFGTIAMAKNAQGATSQWFVNMGDNSFLDDQNFTVFGLALDMTTFDAIAALPTQNLEPGVQGSVFSMVPYTPSGQLVAVESVTGDGFVRGVSFNDADGDGTRDTGESGLAGFTIFADTNQNGALDAGEPSTLTSADGSYALRLPAGTHRIRQVPKAASTQTSPAAGFRSVVVPIAGEVTGANFGNAKLAVDDVFTVDEDSAENAFDVLLNDGGGTEGLTLTTISSPTQGGSATIFGAVVHYTPAPNFFGNDGFSYTIRDSQGVTDTASVQVSVTPVNDPPTANDDQFTAIKGRTETLDVLANDSTLPDRDEVLSIVLPTQTTVQGGSVATSSEGRSVIYTPPSAMFVGNDSFSYSISDGNGGTDQATVNLQVRDFVPRSIRGTVASNSGSPRIGGMPITLTGTSEFGNQVNMATITKPNGSYEFSDLAPGNYVLNKPAAPFLQTGEEQISVQSAASAGSSENISFNQLGRRPEFIDIRDFLGSTPRQYVMAAVTPGGSQAWYSLSDAGWDGVTDVAVQLSVDRSSLTLLVDQGEERSTATVASDRREVEFLGTDSGMDLVRIGGGLDSFDFRPASASDMGSGEGEGQQSEAFVVPSTAFETAARQATNTVWAGEGELGDSGAAAQQSAPISNSHDWQAAFDAAWADTDFVDDLA